MKHTNVVFEGPASKTRIEESSSTRSLSKNFVMPPGKEWIMAIECNGNGLKQAIDDALKMMDEEGTQGFDYPIGEVRGMPIRIVCEPERGAFESTVFKGELHYSAVYEA